MAPRPIQTRTSDDVIIQAPTGPSPAGALQGLTGTMASAYAGLADFGQQVEQMGLDIAKPIMEERGANAVTRDPVSGQLSVQPRIALNSLDEAYNHGATTAFAAQAETDQTMQLQDLAQQHIDDPVGFRAAATTLVKNQAGAPGVPTQLRTPIVNAGLQKVAQLYGGIASAKVGRDTDLHKAAIESQIDQKKNDLLQLANQHGVDTPEFGQLAGEIDSLYGNLEGNPLFQFSPEQHQAAMAELHGQAVVQAALGTFDQALSKNGTVKALASVETMLHTPGFNLSPTQVHAFESEFHAKAEEKQAQIAHADALSARNLRLTYDNNARDGIQLAAQGQLTTAWVIAHKRGLDPTDFASLLRTTTAPARTDDAATVADLMPRVYVNGDISARNDITGALQAGRLTPDTAAKFFGALNQDSPPEVKRWQSYLVGNMKPSTIEGKFDPDAAQRMQSALEDYRDFATATPNAKPQELRQRADDILAIHRLGGVISARPGSDGSMVPLLAGTLDKPDVATSATRVKQRYLALHRGDQNAAYSDPNFIIDMRRLKEVADRAGYLATVEQGAFSAGQP